MFLFLFLIGNTPPRASIPDNPFRCFLGPTDRWLRQTPCVLPQLTSLLRVFLKKSRLPFSLTHPTAAEAASTAPYAHHGRLRRAAHLNLDIRPARPLHCAVCWPTLSRPPRPSLAAQHPTLHPPQSCTLLCGASPAAPPSTSPVATMACTAPPLPRRYQEEVAAGTTVLH
jgi:hypothetical protein